MFPAVSTVTVISKPPVTLSLSCSGVSLNIYAFSSKEKNKQKSLTEAWLFVASSTVQQQYGRCCQMVFYLRHSTFCLSLLSFCKEILENRKQTFPLENDR